MNPYFWVKDAYSSNIFNNPLGVGKYNCNILNTPYFHKQLYSDFNKDVNKGKYAGSAYATPNENVANAKVFRTA